MTRFFTSLSTFFDIYGDMFVSSIQKHLFYVLVSVAIGFVLGLFFGILLSRAPQLSAITLPLIWTNIRTTLTFFIISNINMSFLFVKAMTNGGPDGASEVFLSYMYKQAYTNSTYGYGMAVGVVVFTFSFALAAIVNKVTKREPLEF